MTADPIQTWLNSAGRYPILPKQEIIRLAKKRDTFAEGSAGYNRIVNKICQHNLRLIPAIVTGYVRKRKKMSMFSPVISDLFQQGYLGLRRAAEKYDGTRGYTFSTYANPWIYQAFYRWHNAHDRLIYIPEGTMGEILYRRRNGRPSKNSASTKNEALIRAAEKSMSVASIDVPLEDDSTSSLSDILHEENLLFNQSVDLADYRRQQLRQVMSDCGIKPRVQKIVMTYARKGNMVMTAHKLGIAKDTCQNLYQEALRTIKAKAEQGAVKLKR